MFEIADLVIKKCPSHKKKDQEKYVIFYGPRRPRLLNFQDQTIQQHPRRFWASHGPTPWPMFIFFDWKAHVYSLPTFLAVCVSASFPGETNSRCPRTGERRRRCLRTPAQSRGRPLGHLQGSDDLLLCFFFLAPAGFGAEPFSIRWFTGSFDASIQVPRSL